MSTTHEKNPQVPDSVLADVPENNNNSIATESATVNAEVIGERERRTRRHYRRRHHHKPRPHRDQMEDHLSHTLKSRPSREHVLNQVDKILGSVVSGNIVGIVDESLRIKTSEPVRNIVNGIMNTIFHPFDRFLGGSAAAARRQIQNKGISGNAT